MFDFSDAVQSVGEAFTSLFNYFKTAKEKQCETQIIRDKKRLKAATNIAQQIFQITDEYVEFFAIDAQKKYVSLRKKFDEKD